MIKLLLRFILHALALVIITNYVPGFHVANFTAALIIVAVLALINITIKPLLILLTLPITLITFGLFTFVINIFLFWFVAEILKGFTIDTFTALIVGWLLYSLFGVVIHSLIRDNPTVV